MGYSPPPIIPIGYGSFPVDGEIMSNPPYRNPPAPGTVISSEYRPAIMRTDWQAMNADTLKQAKVGAAIMGALILAIGLAISGIL